MADVENVIYAIERCTCHVPDACRDCPYDAGHPYNECVEMLLKDVLELLKEKEPRVLTWDEVERAEVCWLEERGWEETYAELNAADWNPEYYGKAIRCWNYKPTKEQREAVKWDDE